MTDKSRRTSNESVSDALFDVFGGMNEGYAAGILDGDSESVELGDSHELQVDFEYHGYFNSTGSSAILTAEADEISKQPSDNGAGTTVSDARFDPQREDHADEVSAAELQPHVEVEVPIIDSDPSLTVEPESSVTNGQISVDQVVRVERLIGAIREDGHHAADIDPLGLLPRTEEHLHPDRFGVLHETLEASSSLLAESNDEIRPWLAQPTIGEAIET